MILTGHNKLLLLSRKIFGYLENNNNFGNNKQILTPQFAENGFLKKINVQRQLILDGTLFLKFTGRKLKELIFGKT